MIKDPFATVNEWRTDTRIEFLQLIQRSLEKLGTEETIELFKAGLIEHRDRLNKLINSKDLL